VLYRSKMNPGLGRGEQGPAQTSRDPRRPRG
jgi:hypothetical protein